MPVEEYIPWVAVPNGDGDTDASNEAQSVHILPSYDSEHETITLAEPKRLKPLPPVPFLPPRAPPSDHDLDLARRQRRASGGSLARPVVTVPRKRKPVLFVCNRNEYDSPISPMFPPPFQFQALSPGSPRTSFTAHAQPPIHTIPAVTPMTPFTLGFVQSPSLDSEWDRAFPPTPVSRFKQHCRYAYGGSVGSIPASVLADLRRLGEGHDSSDAPCARDDASSSDEDEECGGEGKVECDSDSWVPKTATRTSMKWVQDLGEDRWVADSYSTLLRAL
ncbi:hypothetical protein GGX14DRAFT_569393 [Mycena pura]|uniref:Uncharacterized protein n=1 Tax=Mycena pura TaxID=153505 RepID=A0AAD6V796_9AGAR|nr:hypothetical protein GGX14DRAFT_569393 [Mycena pura]